ncbi:hypothetical protein CXG81DRAFT_16354 [Caulochytrium protostelioides]|uniref:Secreted protein n=1 Tax=Caulochytrium protostelioides TaxID=1555241 RepID=A0A4P9WRY2_9FUNG|nr:hypothetical protein CAUPRSCDRAFT_12350 [Caulochytrium protostelioides]RKP04217.1 hypothetical protein CXG81DRAFT_16354 [Caulochytrium protostelioides]|eukprot:RKP04217.1 hypothetical protein CXG81DRAFT_16354 [Caulochytrium protostelioides]
MTLLRLLRLRAMLLVMASLTVGRFPVPSVTAEPVLHVSEPTLLHPFGAASPPEPPRDPHGPRRGPFTTHTHPMSTGEFAEASIPIRPGWDPASSQVLDGPSAPERGGETDADRPSPSVQPIVAQPTSLRGPDAGRVGMPSQNRKRERDASPAAVDADETDYKHKRPKVLTTQQVPAEEHDRVNFEDESSLSEDDFSTDEENDPEYDGWTLEMFDRRRHWLDKRIALLQARQSGTTKSKQVHFNDEVEYFTIPARESTPDPPNLQPKSA